MNPEDKIKKLIDESKITTDTQTEKRILGNAFEHLDKLKQQKSPSSGLDIWRIIMKNRMVKLTAAAIVIIAILVGMPFLSNSSSGVVLADVLAKVEQASAFMYKMAVDGNIINVTVSNEYGMKWEMDTTNPDTGETVTQQTFLLPDEKRMLTILPEQKTYMEIEYDDDFLARVRKENNDPRLMIKEIMNSQYTMLGRSNIEGIEVVGFQTNDPAVVEGFTENVNLILWVDIDTWLPVRADIEIIINELSTVSITIDDYQWDIPVVASDFEPIIPEDFSSLTSDAFEMVNSSEEAALDGLKLIAELTGQYPKKLNFMDLIQYFFNLREQGIRNNEGLLDSSMTLQEEMMNPSMKAKHLEKAMQVLVSFQSLGVFYSMLEQDKKDPMYYGESVGPNNTEAVLMRWKVSDNQYRVVFGDLSTLDVTAEELAELEEPLLQQ